MKKFLNSIKYFFWLLSGSNIEILKECPTDHNRHANIGLAIFTTTTIAFATGSLAGYEFGGQTIQSAIVFGIIWSLLVFTIDRSMVLTLKKNPELTESERIKKLLLPILYRLFLSALISFFISIPLELWIFRENIADQMVMDKDNKVMQKEEREKTAHNIFGDSITINTYEKQSTYLDSLLSSSEPPRNYKNYHNIKQNAQETERAYQSLLKNYENKVKKRKEWYSKVPYIIKYKKSDTLRLNPIRVKDRKSNEYKQFSSLYQETKSDSPLVKDIKSKKEQKESLKSQLSEITNSFFESKSNEKMEVDSLKKVSEQQISEKKKDIEAKTKKYTDLIDSHRGFTTKWVALNNVDDFWVIFFIWFIRIVFFTIEMLPTMAKVTTPIGCYDRSIYSYEKRRERYLKEIEDLETTKLKEIEKQKLDSELLIQRHILDNLAEKQNNIANKILDEWEKDQLNKIEKDFNNYTS